MAIKIKLTGFEDLLTKIEKAGGSINKASETCIRKSADIMQSELTSEMQKADVPSSLINAMPAYEVQSNANRYSARVGYKSTAYNDKNPSDYHKVIFLNYGTPNRTIHGKVKARGFIQKAKKKANTKIKKQQEETLNEILRDLQ